MYAQLLPDIFRVCQQNYKLIGFVDFLPAERELNVKIFFVAIVQVSCL